MAPDVTLVAAGGTDDGGLGTSLAKVMDAVTAADAGAGVLILADLGSAVMTAESALEFLGGPDTVRLADAPLVEGAVAAAVAAQSGGTLADVRRAAEASLRPGSALHPGPPEMAPEPAVETGTRADGTGGGGTGGDVAYGDVTGGGGASADVELVNPLGLHARPAATLAGALGAMDVDVTINGVDGQSVMLLMTLAAGQGTTLHVRASGPDAQQAVDLVRAEVAAGFGEL
jgi:PTS hybrid protein